METWTLVGMMGAGKTSVGRKLAIASGREFVDTDQLIQNRLGRSIEKIFSHYGESAFRDHETAIILGLQPSDVVLSTGGGAVVRPENWEHLKSLGATVYLQSSAETLIERLRISKKRRPLLSASDWEDRVRDILKSREAIYLSADITINLDSIELEQAAEVVLATLGARQ